MDTYKELKNFINKNVSSLSISVATAVLALIFIVVNKIFLPRIEFKIYSNEPEAIQIFWDNGAGFSEGNSESKFIDANSSELLKFNIAQSRYLRIDFGDGSSTIQLNDAELENLFYKNNIIANIEYGTLHDVSLLQQNNSLIISTLANDPYIVLSGDFYKQTNSGSFMSIFIYLVSFLLVLLTVFLLIKLFMSNPGIHKKFLALLMEKQNIVWILLIILFDFTYVMTFTYDSSHYFSLASIIEGRIPWSEWAPIRGIVFPLLLALITNILGENSNAVLIFYTILHTALFFLLSDLVIPRVKMTFNIIGVTVVKFIIFTVIIFDPLVFGYYHVVLTEAVAATLLTLSVLVAVRFYKKLSVNDETDKKSYYWLFFYFAIPFGWHLKQPFAFISLIPLFIICLFVVYKSKNIKIVKYLGKHILLIVVILGISIVSWNMFLRYKNVDNGKLNTDSYISKLVQDNFELISHSPLSWGKSITKKYLAMSNIFYFDQINNIIDKTISFTRGSENNLIGYRMFKSSQENSNIFSLPDYMQVYVNKYREEYMPPIWFNNFMKSRFTVSNFLFSLLYLLLPFLFIYSLIMVIKGKEQYILESVSLGVVLGNILIYSYSDLPIDRYIMPGYPLLLLIYLLYIFLIGNKIYSFLYKRYYERNILKFVN